MSSLMKHASTASSSAPAAASRPAVLFSVLPAQNHRQEGHLERPERVQGILQALELAGFRSGGALEHFAKELPATRIATSGEIAAVHTYLYMDKLAEQAKQAADSPEGVIAIKDSTDPDGATFCTSSSYNDALKAAGAVLQLVDAVVAGSSAVTAAASKRATSSSSHAQIPTGFAIVRPPGHHATAKTPLGFCLFNNIAIAARYAQRHHGLRRVFILDFDVHNGNGTAEIFWEDSDVLVADIHETSCSYTSPPYVPHDVNAIGEGAGQGTTVNIPFPKDAGHECALLAFEEIITPMARRFKPDIILVSAGFDAHQHDPFQLLQYENATYYAFASKLKALANELCNGRLIFALEGGYNVDVLGESVVATWLALAGKPLTEELEAPIEESKRRKEPVEDVKEVIEQVKKALGI